MERSDVALRRVRRSYERAHVVSALRGLALAGAFVLLSIGLHRTTHVTWLVASLLAIVLATLGWRGGSARRGALAGVLAGLPVFIAPTIVFAFTHGGMQCPDCALGPTLACLVTCFATSSLVGLAIGFATRREPTRFTFAALATAVLVGLLGCSTTGLGGAIGIVIGVLAGGATGWLVHGRELHA
jgi:hypothetical protein